MRAGAKPRWTRTASTGRASIYEAAKPQAAGTAYINFMPADEADRVEAAYGGNYDRLLEVKRKYDPQNLFRMNQNLRAGTARQAA